MSYDVKFTTRALDDLGEISSYISEYNSDLATLFIDAITGKLIEELSMFPYMYREYLE